MKVSLFMFFKTKKKLEQVTKERDEYKKSFNDYLKQLNEKTAHQLILEGEINNYKDEIKDLKIELEQLKQKYEIMEKYFNLDEPPSENVQAKLLADLRLHDMKYENLQNSIKMQQLLTTFYQRPVEILPPPSYYRW